MIKYRSAVLCFLFLMGSVVSVVAEDIPDVPEVWTARNSVEFSLANSPDSRVAMQRMNMATAAVDQAKVGFYPSVDLSAQYGQTNNPMYSFGNILNQGTFSQSIDFNDPGRTDDLNLRAGVEYRFYNGGRDQAGVEAAEAGFAQSQMERETIHSRLAFEVVRSFQSMVQAEEMLAARNASIAAIRASLSVAQARFQAGDLLKADLLNLNKRGQVRRKVNFFAPAISLAGSAFRGFGGHLAPGYNVGGTCSVTTTYSIRDFIDWIRR